MKFYVAALLFALLIASPSGRAQQAQPESVTYHLHVLEVAETKPMQYVWFVEKGPSYGFTSLDSPTLREWVSNLPRGTTIEYRSPWAGMPIIGKLPGLFNPDVTLKKTVDSFRTFCQGKGIFFADQFPVL